MTAHHYAALVLEDGQVFYGRPFGAIHTLRTGRRGEVVFATAMSGYQEICTDPSYRSQMVVLTYPMIGNYGIMPDDAESRRPWLSALIVREVCAEYSNWRATESLDAYLTRHDIPGICELDTRALTRHLRTHGTLRGILHAYPAHETPDLAALTAQARAVRSLSQLDVVREVSGEALDAWKPEQARRDASRVLLIDAGYKRTIARRLARQGLSVQIAPHTVDMSTVRRLQPDGVVISNGPGDPDAVVGLIQLARSLIRARIPLMGICLGHQVIALAAGATTSRLPFGHHGVNHPVREVRTGVITITSQNHNFQVDAASLPARGGFYISHMNLTDGTVEGLAHEELPVFSVQYHPEAAPGPQENRVRFERFAALIARSRGAALAG
ncbi:MAG TPA: glutamine-hydrolyzing carbamoyl-phosphate synthase small subunit [Ktedonobacterales bacterium]